MNDFVQLVWSCVKQKALWRVLIVMSSAFYLVYLHSYRAWAILLMYLFVSFMVIAELIEHEDSLTDQSEMHPDE